MIKVGSQVYIVPEDTREEPYYAIVKSIGSKYITVEGHLSYSRFSIYTHKSINDRTGWNSQLTLYESKRDYQAMKEIQDKRYKLISKIENKLPNTSLEKLYQIYVILYN